MVFKNQFLGLSELLASDWSITWMNRQARFGFATIFLDEMRAEINIGRTEQKINTMKTHFEIQSNNGALTIKTF